MIGGIDFFNQGKLKSIESHENENIAYRKFWNNAKGVQTGML